MAKKNIKSKDDKAKDFIELAFSLHEDDWVKTAERLRKAVKGQWKKGFNARDRVVSNEAFSLVNLILPHFILNNPYVPVRADNAKWIKKVRDGEYRQHDAVKMARNMEAVINHHIKKIDQVFEDRKSVQDALIYPFGVTKDGYSFETISEKDHDYVVKDTGFHKRINPRDFGWHPMATNADDSPWLVHRCVFTSEQCEEREIKTSELEPGIPEYMKKDLDYKHKKNKLSYQDDYYTFYEVHHQDGGMVYLFGGENKKLIEKKEKDSAYPGSDFNIITFTKDNDDFTGIPMLAMVEPQMWMINEVLSLMIEHIRKFPGQVFANKDGIDEDQIEKIIRGEQGSVHIVNDINGLLRTAPLQMGYEYFQIFNLLTSIIDRILGVPDFQRLAGGGRKSATESSYIQGDATVRRNYFASIVKNFVLKGIEKQAALKQAHQDEKEYIQATGELQNEMFVLSKEDYQGDYIYDFDMDSMGAINEAEFNNLNNMLTVMSNNPFLQPVLAGLDPNKTGKKLFSLVKINYESLTKEGVQEGIIFSPEKENEMALKYDKSGVPMPRPNRSEDHTMHIEAHRKFIEERIKEFGDPQMAMQDPVLNMVMEHLAETEMLENPQQPQQTAMPNAPSQEEIMAPGGPMGPMQQVPQS